MRALDLDVDRNGADVRLRVQHEHCRTVHDSADSRQRLRAVGPELLTVYGRRAGPVEHLADPRGLGAVHSESPWCGRRRPS